MFENPKLYEAYAREFSDYDCELLSLVIQHIPDNARVLDAGCGTGAFTKAISGHRKVIGIDPSKSFVELAQNNYINGTYYCCDLACNKSTEHLELIKKFEPQIIVFKGSYHRERPVSST